MFTPISRKFKAGVFDDLLLEMCVFESKKDTRYSHICISVPLSPSLQVYPKHCLTSWITLCLFLPHTSISTKFTYTRSMLSCQPRTSQNRRIPDVCLSLFPLSRNQTRNKPSIRPMFSCRDLRAQNQKRTRDKAMGRFVLWLLLIV
jgi:hypothetical protein